MIIGTGANIQFLGVLISFIAVIGWAFMSVISRKISNKYSALTLTKVSMLIATICNIPVSFLEVQMTHPLIQVDLGAVLGLVYIGVVCTAFTNILWNKSLSLLPANTCSAFYPIKTLTSSFLGVVVFHEVLTTSFVLGSAFIIVGFLISLLFKKRTRKRKRSPSIIILGDTHEFISITLFYNISTRRTLYKGSFKITYYSTEFNTCHSFIGR